MNFVKDVQLVFWRHINSHFSPQCAKRCIFANLPGAFVDNKLNLKWFKDEARKVTVSANNEAAREQIIKELDNCGKQGA